MATEQDPEEFIEEDEQDEIARRSIFSAGWFRALLVLTVLAIVVVVSLPYLLNWLPLYCQPHHQLRCMFPQQHWLYSVKSGQYG